MTYSGRYVDLNNLTVDDIYLEDIAHSISNLCRYNGHTKKFYSVAEHSVRLARYATNKCGDQQLARALLLHDATEAYVGDIIYHLKGCFPEFIALEDKIGEVINNKFNIIMTDDVRTELKKLDRSICFDEMYLLMLEPDKCLYKEDIKPLGMSNLLLDDKDELGWTSTESKKNFLAMANWLGIIGDNEGKSK